MCAEFANETNLLRGASRLPLRRHLSSVRVVIEAGSPVAKASVVNQPFTRNDLVIGRDYGFNPIASTPAATLALSVKRPMDRTYGPLPNPSPDTEVSEPA